MSRADRPAPQPHPNVGGSLTSANPAENSLSDPRRVGLVSTRAAPIEFQVPVAANITDWAKYTLAPVNFPDAFLGLHFRHVLGDALCDEWGLARRLSRVG